MSKKDKKETNLVRSVNKNIRSSTRKLNPILKGIVGKKVDLAIRDLDFSNKRICKDIKKTLSSAIANAENNFQYDIDCEMFGKFRPQELGYDLEKFISYEKGCYRGQEIIARVTYLGKKNKAAVIFENAKSPITDVAGKNIGKEVFSKNFENLTLHHYYIEKNDYFVEGEQISPYASQW